MSPQTILAINPGGKYLGIALFYGPELKDWRIKAVMGKWSKNKMEKMIKIVSNFISTNKINVITIKKLNPARSSANLNQLVNKIRDFANRQNLNVYQYSVKELEAFFSPQKKINKKQLAELVSIAYPVLFNELNKEKNHKNPYHIRMFEAVALGARCFQQLDKC